MQVANKVIFNTIVLYLKIIVTMTISLVTVPLVLKALGASDYGLYNVVAGFVAMLSFLNNSMTISSQRYMSVAMGTNDVERINNVYNASFRIHLILGLVIVIFLEFAFLFLPKLSISPDRFEAAVIVYQFLVISTFVRFLNVPFNAITNAHEDMLAFSVVEILDSILMLALAFYLQFSPFDRLIFYGIGVALLSCVDFALMYLWVRYAYNAFRINLKSFRNNSLTKEMFGFAGWNVFGSFSVICRNQGVAIIINLFLGTIANAAYGVANQVNGALLHFSATFQKAINPQLMKSEGMNDRNRLHRIAFLSSKFSVLALCLFVVPLIIEMEEILSLWLHEIPPYTIQLSQCILIFSILDQYSSGLKSSIQATGIIKNYQIIMGMLLLMNIPVSYMVLKLGFPVYYVTIGFIVIEFLSLIVRINMANIITGMDVTSFIRSVVLPTILIIGTSSIVGIIPRLILSQGITRLILVCTSYGIVYLMMTWLLAFDKVQRENLVLSLRAKLHI